MIRKALSVFLLGIAALGFASSGPWPKRPSRAWSSRSATIIPRPGQALNVVKNIQNAYGKDKVDIEVVVFGLGAGMLKLDSPLANGIDETLATGAQVSMCENTMKGQKLTRDDMYPRIGYVPAGVIEVIEKQKQGWTVIRP